MLQSTSSGTAVKAWRLCRLKTKTARSMTNEAQIKAPTTMVPRSIRTLNLIIKHADPTASLTAASATSIKMERFKRSITSPTLADSACSRRQTWLKSFPSPRSPGKKQLSRWWEDKSPQIPFAWFRSLDLKNGKQSKGKLTQFKDLYFPKGCGSLDFDQQHQQKRQIFEQISPFARSFQTSSAALDGDYELVPSAQTVNERFADAPQSFKSNKRLGNKNDGFYYPDTSGRYIHDNRGQYIHDNRGLYVHIPGPDGPPALPYEHVIGPNGPNGK